MSNDPHRRFFRLWAKVSMMVVDGRRYPYYVYGVLTGQRSLVKTPPMTNLYELINKQIASAVNKQGTLEAAINALQEIIEGPQPVFIECIVRGNPRSAK